MIAVAFVLILAGYTLTYVGVQRVRGDDRTVTALVMGRHS